MITWPLRVFLVYTHTFHLSISGLCCTTTGINEVQPFSTNLFYSINYIKSCLDHSVGQSSTTPNAAAIINTLYTQLGQKLPTNDPPHSSMPPVSDQDEGILLYNKISMMINSHIPARFLP